MAKTVSKYLQDAMVAWTFGTTMPAAPTAYVALITTAPTAIDGTGIAEVTTTSSGYSRQTLGSKNSTTTSGSGLTAVEQATQAGTLTFGPATTSWGTIVGVAIYDALSGGNLLYYGDLSASQTVNNGNTFQISAGNLTVQA